MRKSSLFLAICSAVLVFSCGEKTTPSKQIVVKNTMNTSRSFETVSVDIAMLELADLEKDIVVRDAETKAELVAQQIDSDGDGKMDVLLFQPEMAASSERVFEVVSAKRTTENESIPACYSRFVPERTDDYAWENNRVAFRTYGPVAQQMVEDGVKGGTLSSGIDAWLKRVDYPIINSWYSKELETDGSYHKDDGEGLDNFHVGTSRGVGGIAKKVDTSYYISKNFTAYKTLSTGPIRTSFLLTYANWDAAGNQLTEEKKISLDYGSNLSKFEITVKGTDTISAGLTLHEKEGEIGVNENAGWISYWEPHADSELGMGIIVPASNMVGHEDYRTNTKDRSNLFAHIKTVNDKAIYYAGFGWKKSGQYSNKTEWDAYLNGFADGLKNPLEVTIR